MPLLLLRSELLFFAQWACSGPILWWMLAQLLATLPPTMITMPNFKRVATVEAVLAVTGLVMAAAVRSPPGEARANG